MRRLVSLPTLLLTALPGALPALTLDLAPGARLAERVTRDATSFAMPVAGWTHDGVSRLRGEGTLHHEAWQVQAPTRSTMELLAPLRAQLLGQGYELLHECADAGCGGFDFRFALDMLGAPVMFVDLGDYRYLAARNGDGVLVSLMVSRAGDTGYIHVSRLVPADMAAPVIASTKAPEPAREIEAASGSLAAVLEAQGRTALDDLRFRSGSAELGDGPYASLVELAAFLKADPGRRVVLVGHTDAVGGLAGNQSLSRRRAEAVRSRLIAAHNVPRPQVAADGVGYLAPRASNFTDEGREANRRVEVMLDVTR